MIKNWEDYSNECWCDRCQHRLIRHEVGNELVIVVDGYGNYYVFDSFECAMSHFRKGLLIEGYGVHSAKLVDKLEDRIKKKSHWHISRTSIPAIAKLVERESDDVKRKLY